MNKLTPTSQISKNPDVVYTQIDDELVVIGPENNLFYGVNAVGTYLWSLLESNPLSFGALCDQVQQQYAVSTEQCIEDVTRFIESMVNEQMLVITA